MDWVCGLEEMVNPKGQSNLEKPGIQKNVSLGLIVTHQVLESVPTDLLALTMTNPGKTLLQRYVHSKFFQSCLTLCNPMDCSLPGSSVYEILQARVLEGVAMPSSRGSSSCRDWACVFYVSCTGK